MKKSARTLLITTTTMLFAVMVASHLAGIATGFAQTAPPPSPPPLKEFLPGTVWVPLVPSRAQWKSIRFTANGKVVRLSRGGIDDEDEYGGFPCAIAKNGKDLVARWTNGKPAFTMRIAADRNWLEYENEKYKQMSKPQVPRAP